jgi:hypothetical protein
MPATPTSARAQRVQALQQAVDQYVSQEQTKINNEVQYLQAILQGRTGGQGLQQANTQSITAVAQNSLAAFLGG